MNVTMYRKRTEHMRRNVSLVGVEPVLSPTTPTSLLTGRSLLHAFLESFDQRFDDQVDADLINGFDVLRVALTQRHFHRLQEWIPDFPKEFLLETFDLAVGLANLGEEEVEIVHVIDGSNTLVECTHDRHCVLG